MWIGYLEEYPDYGTQGETLEDLKEHLRDLHEEFKNETILMYAEHLQIID
jgi:predicted RNase H-like HicB family nuclease